MSIFQRLLVRSEYDESSCIRTLLDWAQPLHERAVAAENLYSSQTRSAAEALLKVIMDEAEDPHLREESACTLGEIYDVIGINYQVLQKVPPSYREEILANVSNK